MITLAWRARGWARRSGALVARLLVLPSIAAALLALAASGVRAQDLQPLPEIRSPVTDTTGTLSSEQIATLTQKLRAFEQRKGSQIAVVLVPTTEPEAIEQYSIRLAEKVKIGRAKVDDGLIILIAMKDRKTRIEVGYGLEGAIPDSVASQVRRQVMNPAFREGRYFDGVNAGTDAFMKIIDGEPLPPPRADPSVSHQGGESFDLVGLLVMGIILVFVVGGVLRSIFGRFVGSTLVGGVAGGGAWLLSGLVPIGIAGGLLAFLFSLVFSNSFARTSRNTRRSGPWAGGGWGSEGWGSGGGWSSSDSWSGGGGGFGGGGSSGGWND